MMSDLVICKAPHTHMQFYMIVAALSAAAAIYWASVPWTFPAAIAVGALATYLWNINADMALHGHVSV